ncbi:MAG: dihydrolipoyl dehydrogenase [Nitrososphaerota archaeon]|nr:dihydrolipoyl dehydrogenase [Nitrososphaerota archaeon]
MNPVQREADLVVIGGGPGGYVCAIRAAQLGVRTVLVEKARLGGECLIAGCIPSKSIISVAKSYDKVREGARFGIRAKDLAVDMEALQVWKASVVTSLESGVATLLKGNKVEVVKGVAELAGPGTVNVKTENGLEEVRAKDIVIATGSSTIQLLGLEFDGKLVISSREALELRALPKKLLIIGGGYIGLEIACMYQRLGSQVAVVELMDQLLPGTEPDLVRYVYRNLEKRGAAIHLKSRVTSVEKTGQGIRAKVDTPAGVIEVEADVALVSVGRRAATAGLNLERMGVELDAKGYIKTDAHMQTNVRGIYAIGDVRGMPLLAHKAQKEGIVAAESVAGLPTAAEWKAVPWTIFTDPEVSGAGLTEKQAVDAGYQVRKTRFPFAALGRALAAGEPDGFVRLISDAQSSVLLGVQIVGPEASDLISEAALAIEMGATLEDLALTIHPHPTLPEGLMEAAEAGMGRPIHQLRP